ncbi:MAG: hypothetical protein SGCHY_000545 [Lobulomycetales sp.]
MAAEILREIEKRAIWLSTYTVHHANNVRPKRDGLKVGGHQASSTSVSTILTALFFKSLQAHDRIAIKPHAQPIFQAIQYMHGAQTVENLKAFRAFKGIQSYPSRTKDGPFVDFSTGSVGLGASMTTFSAWVQSYLANKGLLSRTQGKMYALVGDAELDEGNVFESLLEAWKHDIKNNVWIVDYNRQSLDKITPPKLSMKLGRMFRSCNFNVIVLKYGKRQCETFRLPGGKLLKQWIDSCDSEVYSILCFKGGAAFRAQILQDSGGNAELEKLLSGFNDHELLELMNGLGGHCMETLLECFDSLDSQPTAIIAYTIKGYKLPLSGHRDNHGGSMNEAQIQKLQSQFDIPKGQEWEPLPQDKALASNTLSYRKAAKLSTQEAFGRIMTDIAKGKTEFSNRIVTMSPDVASSTNLSGFINQRGVFGVNEKKDMLKSASVMSTNKWEVSRKGQHFELGIAENNLFLALGAVGLSDSLFGHRLFPVGTLYDPFISRGLDALNYSIYSGARFILASTPSGIALAPEGDQPERVLDATAVIKGAYWHQPPSKTSRTCIVYCGTVASEVLEAMAMFESQKSRPAVLAITSPDVLYQDWIENGVESYICELLSVLDKKSSIATVLDGHPSTLSWVGGCLGHRVISLGVSRFGQSGDCLDLFAEYGIDAKSIFNAVSSLK